MSLMRYAISQARERPEPVCEREITGKMTVSNFAFMWWFGGREAPFVLAKPGVSNAHTWLDGGTSAAAIGSGSGSVAGEKKCGCGVSHAARANCC